MLQRRTTTVALVSSFFIACASGPRAPAPDSDPPDRSAKTPARGEAAHKPDPLRLPDVAAPRAYALTLRIEPAAKDFSGEAEIEVEVIAPVEVLHLHADGLTISHAAVTVAGVTRELASAQSGTTLALALSQDAGDPHFPVGVLKLHLAWTAPLATVPSGIFRVDDGGRSYVFTDLEPLGARRVFPCFDEPRFKTPFTTAIEVPAGLVAVSNNPQRGAAGAAARSGWVRFEFTTTPPLPTYLFSLAVGDFDILEDSNGSAGRVSPRVITAKGKGHLAGLVRAMTPRYLAWLEAWFGSPYPFAKLDIVIVPHFFRAMENPGLVTMGETLALIDRDSGKTEDRYWCENIIAHELAHMWFGNLVTLRWWDDLWLNEAFATWMATKAVEAISPELGAAAEALRATYRVMDLDTLQSARAIRQPIANEGDIINAFDAITYTKGAAVLAMVESWIGREPFRDGVRAYLAAHAHANASTSDLIGHLERASRRAIAPVVGSFVDQSGVPSVSLRWRCEDTGVVELELAQRPHRVLGDPRVASDERWQIPVCVRLFDGQQDYRYCDLLGNEGATWRVQPGFCPTFAHPNVDEAGYYRWETPAGPIALARRDPAAFAGWVASLGASIDGGRLPLSALFDGITPLFHAELSAGELRDLVGALDRVVRFDPAAPDDARFRKKVRALLGMVPLDLTLGVSPQQRRRSQVLVEALARLARDARVTTHANKVGEAFLAELERGVGTSRLSQEAVAVYLPLMTYALGSEPRWQARRDRLWLRLRDVLAKARSPSEREQVLRALAAFDDPALARKTHALLLDGTLASADFFMLTWSTPKRQAVKRAVWEWLLDNADPFIALLDWDAGWALGALANDLCEDGDAAAIESFVAARGEALPSGAQRWLSLALERIRNCTSARARYGAETRAWYRN